MAAPKKAKFMEKDEENFAEKTDLVFGPLFESVESFLSEKKADSKDHVATDCSLLVMDLKRLIREAYLTLTESTNLVEQERAVADALQLQLQNVQYEKAHILKEILKCRQYKSADEDLSLISNEEVYSFFPEEKEFLSDPANGHDLHLKKLDYELVERTRLDSLKKNLATQKDSLLHDISESKTYLESLPAHIDRLLTEIVLPMQAVLDPTRALATSLPDKDKNGVSASLSSSSSFSHVDLLPPPLMVLFNAARAYRDSFPECQLVLDVEGRVTEAKKFVLPPLPDLDLSADEQHMADTHTISQGGLDEEDDGHAVEDVRAAKEGKHALQRRARLAAAQNDLFTVFPLSVVLSLPLAGGLVTLRFFYIPHLHVCTVLSKLEGAACSVSPSLLLSCLLPNHTGDVSEGSCPVPASLFLLDKYEVGLFRGETESRGLGVAYAWLHALTSDTVGHGRTARTTLRSVIEAVSHRVNHLSSACVEFASLEALKFEIVDESLFPLPGESKLLVFSEIETSEITSNQVPFDDVWRALKFVFSHSNHLHTLHGQVCISARYPVVPPFFILSFVQKDSSSSSSSSLSPLSGVPKSTTRLFDNDLQSIALEVNYYCSELKSAQNKFALLSLQLRRLQSCFDLYVATCGNREGGKFSSQHGKLYLRSTTGRDRRRAFHFDPTLQMFTSRP